MKDNTKDGVKHINLDKLTEHELRYLHQEIVKRLQTYSLLRNRAKLMEFKIGDHVEFDTDRETVNGLVIRINLKTASVEASDGRLWRVSPGFLRAVERDLREVTEESPVESNVVELHQPSPRI